MKKTTIFIIVFITLLAFFTGLYVVEQIRIQREQKENLVETSKKSKKEKIADIQSHYNAYVKTNKKATIYQMNKDKLRKVGTVKEGIAYTLKNIKDIDEATTHFQIEGLPYYLSYKDVEPLDTLPTVNHDYKNYIPFKESIVTKKIKLYQGDTNVYDIEGTITSPIIISEGNKKYIEYNDDLYYVKEEDIEKTIPHISSGEIAVSMTVLNYHFFYNDGDTKCNEIMCIKKSSFEQQIKYLADNGYYTISMKEFELFMDKKIYLPKKSVLITVDDGAYGTDTVLPEVLEKYQKKASLFLITGFNDKNKFTSKAVELHSHSNQLHNIGVCPGGQGGGIKCLPEEVVLADLKTTRDLLGNTNAFAYPFYEYNARAIELLKQAGFTMAFIGGNKKAVPGMDKMVIPRYPVVSSTSMADFIKKLV